MLQLLLGCAGSGKTTTVYESVCERVHDGEPCMLIVPEQFSFETERQLLHLLGPKDGQLVQVLSFRRLADFVYRKFGRPSGTPLTDGGRAILMSLALEEVGDTLTFYQGYRATDELIDLLLSFEKELKLCGVSPAQFLQLESLAGEETLQTKIRDIGLVLSAFDALSSQTYLDPLDDLSRILPKLEEGRLFEGAYIYVDGFKDFTVPEEEVLKVLLRQCARLTVSLCGDGPRDTNRSGDLFSPVYKTSSQLIQMARENNVKVATPKVLSDGVRFQNPELRFLEEQLRETTPKSWEEKPEYIRCFAGRSRHDEAQFVAQEIRRLVMEENYRYKDFAIIARDLQPYRTVLDSALDRYEVSYFLDNPRQVVSEPLVQAVLSAFRIVSGGFDSEDVFSYLKTNMTAALSTDETSMLENYTDLWAISGRRWREEWTASPGGFGAQMSEAEQSALATLNDLRLRLIQPLERFATKTKQSSGRELSGAVYDFLLDIGAEQQVLDLIDRLRAMGRFPEAEEQRNLWELLMHVLDQMAHTLGETVLTRERYLSLLTLVLSASEIAQIPEGLDQVAIGEAGRMRPADPKIVFVIGAVQDEFPAQVGESGAFCDRERQEMIELGLPLPSTLDDLERDERYLCYTSLTSGSERLYLTYYSMDLAGENRIASPMVKMVRRIFPQLVTEHRAVLSPESEALTKETSFHLLARERRSGSSLSSTLDAALAEDESYTSRRASLERTVSGLPTQFEKKENAALLFPQGMTLSASQIESYHLCRFQYFCKYGLRAKERKPAQVTALEYGSLMHYLLESLFGTVGHQSLASMEDHQLKTTIEEAIRRYLIERMGGAEDKSARFLALFQRLADAAAVVIRHIARELNQSQFQPVGYEMTLGSGGDYPPLTIETEHGSVTVGGVIDRVDLYIENDVPYVRIIDYKTGRKTFQLFDLLNGINLQMLLYLAALLETGKFRPAGILYMPASRPMISAKKGADEASVRKEVEKGLKMNGLLLDDPMLITAMEEDGAGKYVPATVKDGAVSRSSSTVSNVELDRVLTYMKSLVGQMAEHLHAGEVAASPLKGCYDSCEYCPYFPICCHEENDGGRIGMKLSKSEVLELLAEGEENDEE